MLRARASESNEDKLLVRLAAAQVAPLPAAQVGPHRPPAPLRVPPLRANAPPDTARPSRGWRSARAASGSGAARRG